MEKVMESYIDRAALEKKIENYINTINENIKECDDKIVALGYDDAGCGINYVEIGGLNMMKETLYTSRYMLESLLHM